MRTLLAAALAAALGLAGGLYWGGTEPAQSDVSKFAATEADLAGDLYGRHVVVAPTGQVWGFAPDQTVEVALLEVAAVPGGAVAAVRLRTKAEVRPDPKAEPVAVILRGVARLHYELIAGEWHLADVVSVDLVAAQE